MKKALSITLVGLCLALAGCGGGAAAQPGPTAPQAEGALKPFGESKVGDRQKCPISGEEFTVTDSSPKADYNGKTYYFCCGHCAQKFKEDPAKYLPKGT